ncbi:MAG TPA: hypothetical protein DGK91_05705 [Clostridium sp.]|nr:DUF2232 domain-containing protein [Clostridia bacterium]HCW04060.1 hypothetical protein [Clostridium sp.]
MYSGERTRSLVEAGLLVAITVVISIFVLFVPVLGAIGSFVLPIPIAVLYIRHDFKLSLIASIVSALIVGITLGLETSLSFFALFAIIGLILGYCFKKKVKVSKSLILISFVGIVGYVILAIVSLLLLYKDGLSSIADLIKTNLKESFEAYISLLGNESVTNEIDMIREWIDNITIQSVLSLAIIGLIMMSLMQSFIYYFLTRLIIKRLNMDVIEIGEYDKVYIDNRIGALLIITVSIGAILHSRNIIIGTYIYNIAVIILIITLTVVGSAVIYYYLKNKFKINTVAAAIIIVVILFTPLSIFIVYTGFSDLIFDFRKLDPHRLFKDKRYKG